MPVKAFNRSNHDRVLIYCQKRSIKPTRKMIAEQKRLVAEANERDRRSKQSLPPNPKKVDWVFWIILILVIVL